MTIIDNYFPFDSGPGATATAARWRLMARLWSSTGVIPLFLSSMIPSIAGSVVTIGPGAVWIDGYYGESDSPKTVSVTGNGMIVIRMDPTARQILVVFVPNQTTPTQNQNGIYEVPIALVTGSSLQDIRLFAVEASTAVPTGTVFDFASATVPYGWLVCDGSAVLRSTYAALFAAIGTTWNTGGTDAQHFNVPDLRNRATIGTGSIGALGATGGSQTHTLTNSEMPSHSHGAATGAMNQNQQHYHSIPGFQFAIGTISTPGYGAPNTPPYISFTPNTSTVNTDHLHGIGADGGGGAHTLMQPYAVIQKMIKT